ncbi:hypothetical protein HDU79_000277 [Rhizoclosmatium sp. JEL0117]|nr:hypothetical protein HDU79_000277 [Rhizoclosmatium sp. JEL0117]
MGKLMTCLILLFLVYSTGMAVLWTCYVFFEDQEWVSGGSLLQPILHRIYGGFSGILYSSLTFTAITYLYARSYVTSLQMIEIIATAKRSREANERLVAAVAGNSSVALPAGNDTASVRGSTVGGDRPIQQSPNEEARGAGGGKSSADEEEAWRQKMVLFNCVLLVAAFLVSYLPLVAVAIVKATSVEGTVDGRWVVFGEAMRALDTVASPALILYFQHDFVSIFNCLGTRF